MKLFDSLLGIHSGQFLQCSLWDKYWANFLGRTSGVFLGWVPPPPQSHQSQAKGNGHIPLHPCQRGYQRPNSKMTISSGDSELYLSLPAPGGPFVCFWCPFPPHTLPVTVNLLIRIHSAFYRDTGCYQRILYTPLYGDMLDGGSNVLKMKTTIAVLFKS